MGCELLKTDDGVARLHVMMLDDIEIALQHGHVAHANELADTYRRFRGAHPARNPSLLPLGPAPAPSRPGSLDGRPFGLGSPLFLASRFTSCEKII